MAKNSQYKIHVIASLALQLVLVSVHFGCSSLKTPNYRSEVGDYVPQGEFSTPSELYESKDVIKNAKELPENEFSLDWPLSKLSISQGFMASGRGEHHGLDLRGRKGEPIYASHSGTVIYSGAQFRGYGRMVIIEYNDNWATLYAHMTHLKVKTGATVKAGQVIGTMGRTGRASGVHLHFELMHKKMPIDPIPFLARSPHVTSRE